MAFRARSPAWWAARGEVAEVAGLLAEFRLVTVTGPGGVGKTRLAGEVARRVGGDFADGAWLVELASVRQPERVPAAVAVALGVPQAVGMSITASLAGVLARQQVLLVLDNCEHVAGAAAELCEELLSAADDVRVLATSREPVGVAGEARYRLPPLTVPQPGHPAGAASEAVVLFADRARRVDRHFALNSETGPVVARLDGLPLAIELAAARVQSLGLAQLLDRLDHQFRLLAGADRAAAPRQRSLAATVDWSYQLLGEDEQRVFRVLAIFPGPFSLEAAGVVGGAAAGEAVLRLVDCSLLEPPRTGPDGRVRYLMLETVRACVADRLAAAGQQPGTAAALARYAVQVAERAAAGMQTSAGEVEAARWLDAEDATVHQGLAWALEHDPAAALRLATALAPWWQLRGRFATGYALLSAAAGHAARDSAAWCAAHLWLGYLMIGTNDLAGALGHFTAVRDAMEVQGPSAALADALAGRSAALLNVGRIPEAAEDAGRALAMAREIGHPAGEVFALADLSIAASYTEDLQSALAWARQAQRINPASVPGWLVRLCSDTLTDALTGVGEVAAALGSCADGLARARHAGALPDQAYCLYQMAYLEQQAGHMPEAQAHLLESLQLATRIGDRLRLLDCLQLCGQLCAATHRWAEAVTMWAAYAARLQDDGMPDLPQNTRGRQEPLRQAGQTLGPGRMRAAEERGAAMTPATALEFAVMLLAPDSQKPQAPPRPGQLSTRERD
jgi:predicted ATPase